MTVSERMLQIAGYGRQTGKEGMIDDASNR